MSKYYGKTVLITGASSGIGKCLAEVLANKGYRVYGTSRKITGYHDGGSKITRNNDGFLEMICLDVCSQESIKEAVNYIVSKEGKIDILVNNAGFAFAGAVEDTSADEAYGQFNTNFFGVIRMLNEILPIMRSQKNGLVINIGSVAGLISIPFQSMYSASKYALEAMTEALRMEIKPFGIKAVLIEPGDTKTGFTSSRLFTQKSNDNSPYKRTFDKSIATMERDEQGGPDPIVVAKAVLKILKRKNPPIRIVVGFQYKLFGVLKKYLPSRLIEFIVSKMYA